MTTETNSKIGEMECLAQVTKDATLGKIAALGKSEPWARALRGHLRKKSSICDIWHSIGLVVC